METHREEKRRLALQLQEQKSKWRRRRRKKRSRRKRHILNMNLCFPSAAALSVFHQSTPLPPPSLPVMEQKQSRLRELGDLVSKLQQSNSSLSQQLQEAREEIKGEEEQWKKREAQLQQQLRKMTSTHQHQVKGTRVLDIQ